MYLMPKVLMQKVEMPIMKKVALSICVLICWSSRAQITSATRMDTLSEPATPSSPCCHHTHTHI